ncbi:hypothetical protein GWK08_03020 [Leptobacterium flavescens]|uniref:Lipoprotein n=1 Tax=Leptobacterium flavescens TaxID=472055 RepID=A0A6P0UJ42_9FLAO|nr:hypothetical protein [Leptobacterium flavescens]NER12400.1 hypothetical protein [Leptobacterium flavescens]
MKNYLKKLAALSIIGLGVLSCDSEQADVIEVQESSISVEEIQLSDEADLISEEVTNIVEDVYASDEISALSRGPYNSDYLPDCVTITTVVTDTTVEKTIEFEDGCELPNGNVVSGTIKLSYARDMELMTKTLNFSLENFVFNDVSIEGSSSIIRTRSNGNGNPQSEATANFEAEWPDGTSASFSGTRTREWIEGYGTGFWGDNVFLITGNRTFTNREGTTYSKEILVPLRRELACRFIVSGVLEISRGDVTATLDFGDGTCDSKGILTNADGESQEINLRRFR